MGFTNRCYIGAFALVNTEKDLFELVQDSPMNEYNEEDLCEIASEDYITELPQGKVLLPNLRCDWNKPTHIHLSENEYFDFENIQESVTAWAANFREKYAKILSILEAELDKKNLTILVCAIRYDN